MNEREKQYGYENILYDNGNVIYRVRGVVNDQPHRGMER